MVSRLFKADGSGELQGMREKLLTGGGNRLVSQSLADHLPEAFLAVHAGPVALLEVARSYSRSMQHVMCVLRIHCVRKPMVYEH